MTYDGSAADCATDRPASEEIVLDRNATAAQIRALLLGSPLLHGDADPSSLHVVLLRRSGNSVLFRADHPGLGQSMVVKVCTEFTEAERQIDSLNCTIAAMGEGGRFTVPRPNSLLSKNACIVMPWISGHSIGDMLRNTAVRPGKIAMAVGLAGQWLRRFHDVHAAGMQSIPAHDRLAKLEREIATGARMRQRPTVQAALRYLQANADLVEALPVRFGWHHGDFKPANVLISGDRVFGVDVDLDGEVECINAMANFLFNLDIDIVHPLGWRILPFYATVRRALLEGYARSDSATESDMSDKLIPALHFKWLRLHRVLREWASSEVGEARLIRTRYLHLHFERMTAALLREPAPSVG